MVADGREFLGTGWGFPIAPSGNGGLAWSSGERKVAESIWLVLSTALGERVMRPLVGCGAHDRLFAPDSPATRAAIAEDVDYFCVGPCWLTPTKPGRPAPGLPLVRSTAESATDKPWFAIGGIDATRLRDVLTAGARRIVVVRAITGAEDPRDAAEQLRSALV